MSLQNNNLALIEQAAALVNQNRFDDAKDVLAHVLKSEPTAPQAWFVLGMCLGKQGRIADGAVALGKAVTYAPDEAQFVSAYGFALKMNGQIVDARAQLMRAAELAPTDADVRAALGEVLLMTGEADAAVDSLRAAVAIAPQKTTHRLNLALALSASQNLGAFNEAKGILKRLIDETPNFGEAHLNLGIILQRELDFPASLQSYQRALATGAKKPVVFFNLSTLYSARGDYKTAFNYLDKAIDLDANYAEAHFNRGLQHLMLGQWRQGWAEYEWRWNCPSFPSRRPSFAQPRWQGQHVDGKILAWGEQGIGDEILFSGFIRDALASGHRMIGEVEPRVLPLMRRANPGWDLIARTDPPDPQTNAPDIVAQIPVGSVGAYVRNTPEDFERPWSPVLKADAEKVSHFRQVIDTTPGQPVVGLSWISTNALVGTEKSITPTDLAPIFSAIDARWIDLQYGDTDRDRAALFTMSGTAMFRDPAVDLKQDIESVAALIELCDVVVTVSNTTAHVAAGLGARVLVMVPAGNAKLWYWGETGTTSPWYPTAEILRQSTPGNWSAPLDNVARQLKALANA